MAKLVSFPDQIFRVCPVDSSQNRVWTLSLRKLGQVYIWLSGNWVIVGVNYIISICFGTQKFASWQFMMMHLLYLSNLIGATTWQYATYNYIPVLPVNVSRPYFLTRPQGVHAKNVVSGDGKVSCLIWKYAQQMLVFK